MHLNQPLGAADQSQSKAGPLVSCIMPTHNRRRFVSSAIAYFLQQDYPFKELIIIDDGSDPIGDLVPRESSIHYTRLNRRATVGAKRNLACAQAQGEVIAHWDDDDWSAPHRLTYQVSALWSSEADICGLSRLLLYDIREDRAWRYVYPNDQRPWLSGASLCYRKAFWECHRFSDTDIGEDAYFVWSADPAQLVALDDSTFHVSLIHETNVSPKQTSNPWWHPYPADEVRRLLGLHAGMGATPQRGVKNVFACLVHEQPDCILDLVRNLSYLDSESKIILYNGSSRPDLLGMFPYERLGVRVHPSPQPQAWGRLHDFALDCMRLALDECTFDTLTIVDSDQLATRPGYSRQLSAALARQPSAGLFCNSPERQPPNTRVGPAAAAFAEVDLWRPFLRRFASGEERFAHWSFWPSTVFTASAARDLTALFEHDAELASILNRSRIWATEEVILPTLVALLGYEIARNPCSYDFVKYRVPYERRDVDTAMARGDVFWMHPVPRRTNDPLRTLIRSRFNHYARPLPAESDRASNATELLLVLPVLTAMSAVEGWLEPDEADLLLAASRQAFANTSLTGVALEVGSYCGRSTVVLGNAARAASPRMVLYAVDPHDGIVGARDQVVTTGPSTLERFNRNVAAAGLTDVVRTVQKRANEVDWHEAIRFLFIDGLHDYASVATDFYHFEPYLVEGGLVAFHDYAEYYPGVKALVHELLHSRAYQLLRQVRSLVVLRKSEPRASDV